MSTQHTHGPWRYDERTRNVLAPDGAIVCRNGDDVYGLPADGHLLAAAPDLLVALHRALAVIVCARAVACNEPIGDPLVMELQTSGGAVLAAQLAIARAEGRTA